MGAGLGIGVILRVRFALGAWRNGEEEVCKHAWRGESGGAHSCLHATRFSPELCTKMLKTHFSE